MRNPYRIALSLCLVLVAWVAGTGVGQRGTGSGGAAGERAMVSPIVPQEGLVAALANGEDPVHGFAPRIPAPAAVPNARSEERDPGRDRAFAGGGGSASQTPVRDTGVRLELHPVARDDRGLSVRFIGSDPEAPRALSLWRLRGERAAVVARTTSQPDGRFAFAPLMIPSAGLQVVATGAGRRPEDEGASPVRRLGSRIPRPPRATAGLESQGVWWVHVVPSEAAGAVRVASEAAVALGRFELSGLPGAAPRSMDLLVAPGDGADRVWLAHELPDGRLSEWRPVMLEFENVGEPGARSSAQGEGT